MSIIKKWSLKVDRGIKDKTDGEGPESLAKNCALWLGSILYNENIVIDDRLRELLDRIEKGANLRAKK